MGCMEQVGITEGWRGFLSFSLVNAHGKTVVKDKRHLGPLMIQRPLYQEKDRPCVLIIHPPGGIAGGDQLELAAHFKSQSKAMISTPSATKFYRSDDRLATQNQIVKIDQGAQVEWLPQETLFFDQSKVSNQLSFNLQSRECALIAWDIVGLGRPARGEGFERGELTQSLSLWIEDKLVFVDRLKLQSQCELLSSDAGLAKHNLFATALFYSDQVGSQKLLLEQLQAVEWSLPVGVTRLGNLVVLRVLASELDEIKAVLFESWQIARPLVMGLPVVKPRIWNT